MQKTSLSIFFMFSTSELEYLFNSHSFSMSYDFTKPFFNPMNKIDEL